MLLSRTRIAIFLATLQASVHAAPTPNNDQVKRGGINDCGPSTFINQSSSGSPALSDCMQIVTNLSGDGTFTVSAIDGHHTIASFGTCAFEVQTDDILATKIGNQDIKDLITTSIEMFVDPGQTFLGAKGNMGCSESTSVFLSSVNWAIIKT